MEQPVKSRGWTPERTARFKATMRAKRREKIKSAKEKVKAKKQKLKLNGTNGTKKHAGVFDAIVCLQHAERSITSMLQAGTIKKLDDAHLSAIQALRRLEQHS